MKFQACTVGDDGLVVESVVRILENWLISLPVIFTDILSNPKLK
jgi:hypothetical protein